MAADDGIIDKHLLADTVGVAVRFLDDLIEVADYPLPFITKATRATRKIGIGFTGLADALIKARLPYDSLEGREFAGTITRLMQQAAHTASAKLAEEKGCFPIWDKSVFYPDRKRRNAACISIAPTGSITAMAGCEGYGIEPIFAVAYTKATDVVGDFKIFSPLFLEAAKEFNPPAETLAAVAEKGSCQGIAGIPEKIAGIFKGAREIRPEDHLLMQAAVQQHVDNAVSKTINLPEESSAGDISACFKKAFNLGLKGVTVFREGSKKGPVTVGRAAALTADESNMEFDRRSINSWPDQLYIEDGQICGACGRASVERAEGCIICKYCGAAGC
jgi:ribonucleoside-diphosphate reductase alpha chain